MIKTEIIAAAASGAVFIFIAVMLILRRAKKKRPSAAGGILSAAGLLVSGSFTTVMLYFSACYAASPEAVGYLQSTSSVTVTDIGGAYLFDGSGETDTLIFYPGAKVEYTAYSPLMSELAEKGIDCILVDMPLNFAIFRTDTADKYITSDSVRYHIGGHSLGGVAASSYASKNSGKLSSVIFLASYPVDGLKDMEVLSIYGTNDGCLNMENYEKAKALLPEGFREIVIDGGNHAQFGSYGDQSGDLPAAISPDEQRDITAEAICSFIESITE